MRNILRATTVLLVSAVMFAGATTVRAEGGSADGEPLGDAVAKQERAYALSVKLPAFTLNGTKLIQDRAKDVPDAFKNPAERKCKPFCVQATNVDGATTITLEDFPKMADDLNSGKTLLVDMRTPDWYEKETLPGSINIPYSDLTGPETKAKARMNKLKGKDIIAFCNGWWCGQSPTGIKALQRLGYTGKIYYFRGGNQDWADAGLPSVKPN